MSSEINLRKWIIAPYFSYNWIIVSHKDARILSTVRLIVSLGIPLLNMRLKSLERTRHIQVKRWEIEK